MSSIFKKKFGSISISENGLVLTASLKFWSLLTSIL